MNCMHLGNGGKDFKVECGGGRPYLGGVKGTMGGKIWRNGKGKLLELLVSKVMEKSKTETEESTNFQIPRGGRQGRVCAKYDKDSSKSRRVGETRFRGEFGTETRTIFRVFPLSF